MFKDNYLQNIGVFNFLHKLLNEQINVITYNLTYVDWTWTNTEQKTNIFWIFYTAGLLRTFFSSISFSSTSMLFSYKPDAEKNWFL